MAVVSFKGLHWNDGWTVYQVTFDASIYGCILFIVVVNVLEVSLLFLENETS